MGEYVTHLECSDFRKDICDKISNNTEDITELKIVNAKMENSMATIATIGKALFAVVGPGIVTIIIILLTRGL